MPCQNIFSNDAINSIYSSVNTPINLNSEIEISICEDVNCKNVKLKLRNGDNDISKHCHRDYFRSFKLIGTEGASDKVASHKLFILNDEYMNMGIAKSIHDKELEAYRTYGFKEIHLDAASYGIVVWPRLFFKFNDEKDEKRL